MGSWLNVGFPSISARTGQSAVGPYRDAFAFAEQQEVSRSRIL